MCQSRRFAEIFPKKPSDHVACVPPRVPHITWRPLRTGFEVNCYSIHQRIVGRHIQNPEKRRRVRKKIMVRSLSVHSCLPACLPAHFRLARRPQRHSSLRPHTSRIPHRHSYLTHTPSERKILAEKASRRGSTSVVTCDLQLEPSERDLVRILLQAE